MAWPVLPHGFLGAQGSETDNYQIQRSLRFNLADSAYLNRTPASAGNRKTWTWSGWVKRGKLGTTQSLFARYTSNTGTGLLAIAFWNDDTLRLISGSTDYRVTTAKYRDVSSWYHLVCSVDTTNATANNRIRFYVNGSEVTSFLTTNNFNQNDDTQINENVAHYIGYYLASVEFDGYLAEINFIDGQALTPSYFGETDPITGRWKAKAYTGDYGANGFYLNFSDNSGTTATTLGKDSAPISGTHTAANNWTPNNFSVTAGAGNDSLTDSPSNYGTISTTLTDDTYQISRSLRFNSADSAYLSRTPASAGNRKTWTWSGWVKRAKLDSSGWQEVFASYDTSGNTNTDNGWFGLSFQADKIRVDGWGTNWRTTTQVFRDVSSWYHVVLAVDTTNATAGNRIRLYINGSEVTSFSTTNNPTQNFDTAVNATFEHNISSINYTGRTYYFDGYLTEINFIDGQALTPDSFGVRDSNYLWKPKAYTGTYGTNGFYLNFSDNSGTTATTLGKDQAGSNNWTPNNFSVASGVGNDSLVDTPTYYGTDAGAGGEARGDYATLNPLQISGATSPTVTNGNLVWTGSNSAATPARIPATIPITSGKWYFEVTRTDNNGLGNYVAAGITNTNASFSTGQYGNNPTSAGGNSNEWALTDRGVACNGSTYTNISSTIGTVGQNDVIRVCVDMDNKKIWFGKNATFSGTPASNTGEAFSNLPASVLPLLYVSLNTTSELAANFGQRPFAYAAPSGFRALRDYNKTPVPTGGVVRGNYCTLNPLDKLLSPTLVNGNLEATVGDNAEIRVATYVSFGKWYWEVVPTTMTYSMIGVGVGGATKHWGTTGISYYGFNGNKYVNGTASAYGASYTNNDVIGVALDLDNLQITFYKNNVSQGTITGLTAGSYTPALSAAGNSSVYVANFGQRPFAFGAPFGFMPLCTTLLPTPTIKKPSSYMDVVTYTGNGSTQTISGLGFSPDLVWVKGRSVATNNVLFDTVRGANREIQANNTSSETTRTDALTSFNSNGFSLGTDAGTNVNFSGATFVAWAWDAGEASSTNTAGSITSTVRVNAQAGVSIVSWTDDTSTNNRVGHGLGVAPAVVLYKQRNSAGDWYWTTTKIDGSFDRLSFNTSPKADIPSPYTAPTSTTFSNYGSWGGATMIAYCFAEVEGFSKFGLYTGNGSTDGPFIYTGFRPRLVMVKLITDLNHNWFIWDSARSSFNQIAVDIYPNLSDTEATNNRGPDFLSNGFKLRALDTAINSTGREYIFAAFAESPFKYARAR